MVAKSLQEKREYGRHHKHHQGKALLVLTGLSTLDIIRIVKEAQYGRRKSAMPSVEVAPVQEI